MHTSRICSTWFRAISLGLLLSAWMMPAQWAAAEKLKTRNVIYVMMDGVRVQEMFGGADAELLPTEGGAAELTRLRYWRDTPEARRETLMPFIWGTIAKNGQIFGDETKNAPVMVSNGLNFSYPGYSETLCGVADPRVDSNKKIPNPNVNVLEWINSQKAYRGKVAAFGAWDLFPFILNRERSGLLINAGYEPFTHGKVSPAMAVLNRCKENTIRYWQGEPFDVFTYETAFEYFRTAKPRVMFVSLGEQDEWAHGNRYDLYLQSIQLADRCIRELWETAQSMRQYRGNTTIIVSTDHGRGLGSAWTSHGKDHPNSAKIWMAVMGPDTPPLGVRENIEPVCEAQMAATVAAFLGLDFRQAVPAAAPPVPGVIGTMP
ncbi:MAG TPA: alkaline phosphatase family protein [Candidatus Hydrogenedentes bacterium]|nr:alkaline phosphatase family protein [Candidatus Hydrogenedentota bacterium]HOJ67775.1 alkaline phosphatase family protein [Candidatus Hydrogenedentota bacterium]HOK89835.1 alkaline phosphatase family protein [Candidatus Hydrogenedentota bacterium]